MKRRPLPPGLYYDAGFLQSKDVEGLSTWLRSLQPLWEERYSKNNPPPPGEKQRMLLRPVYWLGNWQFACLNYYHPPRWVKNCCVKAEPFPAVLQNLVFKIEKTTRALIKPADIPKEWKLNTCLVNYYGNKLENGKKQDVARVGEHKDFEPGPVASLSIGERALFQFVESWHRGERDGVVFQQWLDNGSLMIFGGYLWKEKYFHRVQRVDRREKWEFPLSIDNFTTRRINLTLRYVPEEHLVRYKDLPKSKAEDVQKYITLLSEHSDFFKQELNALHAR